MKTFTDAEIKRLKEQGRLSDKDYLKIALSPKLQPAKDSVTPDILSEIKDAVLRVAAAMERDISKPEEPIVVQSAAPVVNVSMPEEKPEAKERWRFNVRRDAMGRLETVDAVEL